MEQHQVAAALATLEQQGLPISIRGLRRVLGAGSPRDITRHLHALLPVAPAPPPAQEPDPPPEPPPVVVYTEAPPCGLRVADDVAPLASPPTLLGEAEAHLRAATTAANAARRGRDFAPLAERAVRDEQLRRRERERRQAQDRVDALQRSRAGLRAGIPSAELALRSAESALAEAKERARKTINQAQRQVDDARAQLAQMRRELTAIAGAEAGPAE